jgi:hypothetical protein
MPLFCSQTEGSRGDDDDARSTTSSSSRKSSGGRQQAARAATIRHSRGTPGSRVATMGDYIEQALDEQRRKAERKAVAAAARTFRSERRASGEGSLPPVNEQPGVRREASKASASTGSPMSTTVENPELGGVTPPLPAARGPVVDQRAADYDSSDEEGAHKPPSPPPEPLPAQQPLPPPPMQLAAQAHCLAAKLPAVTTPVTGEQQSRTRPRTTRVSDTKSRGRRQSFIEFAERERSGARSRLTGVDGGRTCGSSRSPWLQRSRAPGSQSMTC